MDSLAVLQYFDRGIAQDFKVCFFNCSYLSGILPFKEKSQYGYEVVFPFSQELVPQVLPELGFLQWFYTVVYFF